MARGKRGGVRTPRNPAAVSGPGALSQRTDGGPARPPVIASGQGYGVRQGTEALAGAAPMYGDQPSAPAPSPGGASPMPMSPAPAPLPDIFGPSQRGGPMPVNPAPPSARDVLQVIYEAYPSPWIQALLDDFT